MNLERLLFESRTDFCNWLADNCMTSSGIWLVFSKCTGMKNAYGKCKVLTKQYM